jgi:hypothetical protein
MVAQKGLGEKFLLSVLDWPSAKRKFARMRGRAREHSRQLSHMGAMHYDRDRDETQLTVKRPQKEN